MADGQHRSSQICEVGDAIYGTVQRGRYRRSCAYERAGQVDERRSRLQGDARGRHGTDRERRSSLPHEPRVEARDRRRTRTAAAAAPHDGSIAGGDGAVAPQPAETPEYRRGYLCGMIRGDGHLGSYPYDGRAEQPVRSTAFAWPWPTSRHYVVPVTTSSDSMRPTNRVRIRQGGRQPPSNYGNSYAGPAKRRANRRADRWPTWASRVLEEGISGRYLRRRGRRAMTTRCASPTPTSEIIAWTADSLKRFGFDVAYDRTRNPNGLTSVRIRGGLSEHLRFFLEPTRRSPASARSRGRRREDHREAARRVESSPWV